MIFLPQFLFALKLLYHSGIKELIKLVYDSTYNRLNSNIVDEKERNDIAFKLAIATIKYSDLLPNRLTDYIFDIEKFTSLDGKTAPYVLYTTIRAKSVLGKVEELPNKYVTISTIQEREFIIELLKLSNILNNSYKQKSLNEICEYIYRICFIFQDILKTLSTTFCICIVHVRCSTVLRISTGFIWKLSIKFHILFISTGDSSAGIFKT